MRRDTKKKLLPALAKSSQIAIVTHTNPDGDAMGSSLGLMQLLKKTGKKVKVIVPNDFPPFLNWLPQTKTVLNYSREKEKVKKYLANCDLLFVLDFNAFKRVEELGKILEGLAIPKVLVDHHREPEKFANYFYYDVKACSTCELVYDMMIELGYKKHLDKKIASCLYTGLMTDTGSFRFPSVTKKTHQILAELLSTGIKPSDIHAAVYDTYSRDRMKLLGYALNTMEVLPDNKTAFMALSEATLKKFNYVKGDTEGLVNYPFSIQGIELSALFMEWEGVIKISFRSKGNIDVNSFARKHFNGGGHLNAAGGRSNDSLQETVKKFISLIERGL